MLHSSSSRSSAVEEGRGPHRRRRPAPRRVVAAPASDPDRTLSSERHKFPRNGFSIRFPKDFAPLPVAGATVAHVAQAGTGANVNVRVVSAKPGDREDDILTTAVKGGGALVPNAVASDQGEFVVDGSRCVWVQFTHGPPARRVDARMYVLKRNAAFLMVIASTPAGDMKRDRAAFDDCARSVKFE